jgi:hypothetical protein
LPRRLVLAPLATALVTLLAACAPEAAIAPDAASALAARTSRAQTGSGAARAGGSGGAVLVSGPTFFAFVTNDPQRQLTSTLGATLAGIALDCSGGSPDAEVITYRTLTAPSGKVHEHAQAEDVTVLVWAGYYDFSTDFCAFVASTPLLAVGTADYVLNSHNLIAPVGAPGATVDAIRAHGTVTNVQTGEPLHLVVRAGSLVTGGGTDKGYNNHIQLTPLKR